MYPESYRIRRNNANYTAITPLKVIQNHRFWYQSKAHICDFQTYLMAYTVSKLWPIIGQIFACDRGCFTLTPSLGVIPCVYPDNFTSPETRTIALPDAENRTIFIPLDKTPERDGRTDISQNWFSYYSSRHCEQCGRAVKSRQQLVKI